MRILREIRTKNGELKKLGGIKNGGKSCEIDIAEWDLGIHLVGKGEGWESDGVLGESGIRNQNLI